MHLSLIHIFDYFKSHIMTEEESSSSLQVRGRARGVEMGQEATFLDQHSLDCVG